MKKKFAAIFAIGILLGILLPLGFNILNAKLMNLYLSEIYRQVNTDEKEFHVNISFLTAFVIVKDENDSDPFNCSIEDLSLNSFPRIGNWTLDVDLITTQFNIPLIFPQWKIVDIYLEEYYILFHGNYLPWEGRGYSYWVKSSTIDFTFVYKTTVLADYYNVSKLYFDFFF